VTVQPQTWRAHLPLGSDFEVGGLRARHTLPRAWAGVWRAEPDAPLLLDAGAGAHEWCRAGELDDRSAAAAAHLWRLGLGPGDRMVWSASSSLSAVIANIAALRAGLVVVPVNPAYTDRELAHIVGDVRPAAAVIDRPERAPVIAAASGASSDSTIVLSPDLDPLASSVDTGDRGDAARELDDAAPSAPALIAYTSGTTGAPKGAVLSHANLLANSESIALTWRWEPSDRLIHALPVFHGHGLCVALYTSLLVGGSAVLLPRFDAQAVLDARRQHRATMFFGVPTMYHRLAGTDRLAELSRLRLAVSGSAALRAELHREIRARAGVDVLERYGMTETLMTLSNPYDGERRPGTVGFPFPGVEARFEPDGPADGGAELWVRGPAVFSGYWERPAATAASFEGSWFRTGDVGVVDDGYVRLLGRSSEVIISGGYNVYPAEVEDVLLGHPSVAEVAVAGLRSDEWGETVCAWVVTDGVGAVDPDELLAYSAHALAPYKRPREIRFVDTLPRNSMGKVRRSELR
jgi:malonyl-CoA/methylmalonyl-CoA synthetase